MKNLKPLLVLTLMGSIALPAFANGPVVRTQKVKVEKLQQHQRVTGNLQSVSDATLAARESGFVSQILVENGQLVEQGDLLVQFDDRRLAVELESAQAELAGSKSRLDQALAEQENAQADLDAFNFTASSEAISERRLRQAKTALQIAKAGVNGNKAAISAAQARIDLLNVRMDDLAIKAPFSGVVTDKQAEIGEWFNPGQPVLRLVANQRLEAWLDVPERLSQEVQLTSEEPLTLMVGGLQFSASDRTNVGLVDTRARTFSVIAKFNNEEKELMPGMSVSAWVPVSELADVTTVSKSAVVRRNGSPMIFQVTTNEEGSMAQPMPVDILFYTGDRVAIAGYGLSGETHVVIEGNERLMPGPVSPIVEEGSVAMNTQEAAE